MLVSTPSELLKQTSLRVSYQAALKHRKKFSRQLRDNVVVGFLAFCISLLDETHSNPRQIDFSHHGIADYQDVNNLVRRNVTLDLLSPISAFRD